MFAWFQHGEQGILGWHMPAHSPQVHTRGAGAEGIPGSNAAYSTTLTQRGHSREEGQVAQASASGQQSFYQERHRAGLRVR